MGSERFIAIPPGAIIPGTLPDFKIYFAQGKGAYVLWALEGNKVTLEQLERLVSGGRKEVFIELAEEIKYDQYLETNLKAILENDNITDEHKAIVFSRVSANILKAAYENSMSRASIGEELLQRLRIFAENSLHLLMQTKSLAALAKMIGHDYQTYEHSTKIMWLTVSFLSCHREITEKINSAAPDSEQRGTKETLIQCGIGALLHDIGKALIDLEILNKPGTLTEVEWEIIKRHPLNSLAMLIESDLPNFVKKAILQHHEDFDGGGYPMGLSGDNIGLLARLLRIVDVFDAMTSKRPYKAQISPRMALEIMTGRDLDHNLEVDERDRGMIRSFDRDLLQSFIVFLGKNIAGRHFRAED